MIKFLQQIALRLVEWFTRPRNVGLRLIGFGLALLVVLLSASYIGQFDYLDDQRRISFTLATTDSIPEWVMLAGYSLGTLLVFLGLGLVLYSFWCSEVLSLSKLLVVIEIRGLHSSPDTPSKDADFGKLSKQRQWLKLDFRPKSEEELVDPQVALAKVSGMKANLQTLVDGRNPSDVALAVGGLASVPALFLVGMLLDDESETTLFDWQRDKKKWSLIDGPDDGKRTLPVDYSAIPSVPAEVILVVSLSYQVNLSAVELVFPGLPLVQLLGEEIAANSYWSSAKQEAVVIAFRAVVQELLHRGVHGIHLILAAPASLSIRLGMSYDRRLWPPLLVYQFERTCTPPYPWALSMPTHGQLAATVFPTKKELKPRAV